MSVIASPAYCGNRNDHKGRMIHFAEIMRKGSYYKGGKE